MHAERSQRDPALTRDWSAEAEKLIEEALDAIRGGEGDPVLLLEHAAACLRVEMGELAESELAEMDPVCICPPELLARGGFKGGCPVHG